MLFFCSMTYAKLSIEDYTEYPYNLIMDPETNNEIMNDIPKYVTFSDKGVEAIFENKNELRCYILYRSIFQLLMEPDADYEPTKATIVTVKNETPQ